jgi:hypothetical protein
MAEKISIRFATEAGAFVIRHLSFVICHLSFVEPRFFNDKWQMENDE